MLTSKDTELVPPYLQLQTLTFLKSLERYLSAHNHAKVSNDNDLDSDDDDPDVYEDSERPEIRQENNGKTHNCPFKGCDRNESFKSRQRLRRHFEQRKSYLTILSGCFLT
jgi:hypothetical protein